MKLHEIGISYSVEDMLIFESKEGRIRGIMNNRAKVSGIESAIERDQNFQSDSAEEAIKRLADADPSRNGKYVNWIVDRYIAQNFMIEDLSRVAAALTYFEQYARVLDKKDINQYRKLSDLEDALEAVSQKEVPITGKEEQRQESAKAKAESEMFMDTPNFKVVIPKTEEASCYWGRGTKWCTAATESDNMFDTYHQQGPIYTIMAKIGGKTRKFQLHYESDQFMDEKDDPVGKSDITKLSELPEYTDFLNRLIQMHYSKYLSA